MMKIDKEKPQILQSTERQHYTKDVVLQESKTDWRSLVMNAPNIITIVGRDGIIHFINHTVSGITIQDVIGNKVYEFVLPEFRDLVKQKIEKVFESGESDYYESAALSPDGSVAWYENYVGPIVTDNKVVAVSLVATDISERRQAEETIRSLAQFPSENHSPVMRVDRDGTLLFANQASAKLLTLWKSIVGEKLPESWRDIVMSAIESGEDYIQEVMCGDRIFSLHITPIEDSDYANIYGHDITELKKAEQTISSLARFPSENRNPVMRVDQEGTILYANDTSAPLLALCSLDEKQQLPNDWRSPVLDAIFNDQPATFEVACDDRIFSLDITPIIKAGYANIYGRDVTEQKNSEILLREQNQFINTVFESQQNRMSGLKPSRAMPSRIFGIPLVQAFITFVHLNKLNEPNSLSSRNMCILTVMEIVEIMKFMGTLFLMSRTTFRR
jgi:PAS domain S-box-containing protein